MSQVYINKDRGNDANPGSQELPFMSFAAALASPYNNEIFVEDGIYTEIIDSTKFDQVRRKIIGLGDVFIAAQGNSSSFTGGLSNCHLFKNIKFVNYTDHALQFGGGAQILTSCFFKPLTSTGSRAIYIRPKRSATIFDVKQSLTTLDVRKCEFLDNQTIFDIDPNFTIAAFELINLSDTLCYGHTYQIKNGAHTYIFTNFLTPAQDLGNYYDNNVHLANGGINSTTGENPPLFIDPTNGNYDLQITSSLIGAGYLGSDIGSFHDYCPFNNNPNEPISIFDAGWQNDNSYFNIQTKLVGPDGPSNAAGMIQMMVNGIPQWAIDIASTPGGQSGRLLSTVVDMQILRTITRVGWAAIQNTLLASGHKQEISNSNLIVPDLEIRGSAGIFQFDDNVISWQSFNRTTNINLLARFAQLRAVFRLNGN